MDTKKLAAARVCLDCGADISARGPAALRCNLCAVIKRSTQHRAWALSNPEKRRATNRKYAKENKDAINIKKAKWIIKNPEKAKLISNKKRKNEFEIISDSYVSRLSSMRSTKRVPELIEMKREQILGIRALRELTSTLKELTSEK